MKLDSIIFDLDGTLWDSTEGVIKAWNIILADEEKVNYTLTKKDLEGIMGLQVGEIGAKLFPQLSYEQAVALVKHCCEVERDVLKKEGGILYGELENIFMQLSQNYSLFIVSNCECGYIETFLDYYKLNKYIKGIECAGNTGKSKGENIKLIIERNKLMSSVYVGDTEGDHKAAEFAGIPFVYAEYGFGSVSKFDYKIKNITEIQELVAGIE